MANVPELVRVYAAGFEIPRQRVFVTARTMREDPAGSLLPRDPVGRNQSTPVPLPGILNLLAGLAVGDPIANVAALVRAYRDAAWVQPMAEVLGEVPERKPILGGQNLGLDLEGLVDFLARPSEKERDMRRRWSESFGVTLVVGEALMATVTAAVSKTGPLQVDHYDAKGQHTTDGGQTFPFQGRERPVVPLRRVVHLGFAHFELAAALWADSLKHGAVYTSSLLDSSNDDPENETADAPGRVSAVSESKPYDDTRTETDTTHKVSCLNSADFSSCVCGPSSGVETSSHRTRSHEPHPAPHHHALL